MKIIFFNHFHNGDVHLSRGFIQQIMEKFPDHSYAYAHKNQPNLVPECKVADMPNCDAYTSIHRQDGAIYLNTWYGQQHSGYISQHGITFDCLYAIFDAHCRTVFNQSLAEIQPDLTLLFPHLKIERYHTEKMKDWLSCQWQHKTIMFENGQALSGQAENFDMNKVVLDLANEYPDLRFIVSKKIEAPANVYYTGDIIQKPEGTDLNEISFLANRSRLFIGRTSGVTSICMTRTNLFWSQLRMMLFCYDTAQPYWLKSMKDRIQYTARITVHGETDVEAVKNLIRKEI